MRSVNAATLAQLAARELRTFILIDKVIGETHLRMTNCDVPLLLGTDLYQPRQFSVGSIRYSAQYTIDSVRLAIENIDSLLTALYAGADVQGSETTIMRVAVDAAGAVIGEEIVLFPGLIDDWNLDETMLDETLRSRLSRGDVCTLSRHMASCAWQEFKGSECGYSGEETWCDRSYMRCNGLDNAENFGGDRWLPSIATKEMWWGRVKG